MDFEGIKNTEFFVALGYVTIISSILTIIIMQIYKMILKKKKVLTQDIDPNKKDAILAKAGRIIALILYTMIYLGNEYYLKHVIVIDGALLTGIISGSAATLTLAKGLYTSIRQYQKKKTVFEKLDYAEEKIKELNAALSDEKNKKNNEAHVKEEKERIFIIEGKR